MPVRDHEAPGSNPRPRASYRISAQARTVRHLTQNSKLDRHQQLPRPCGSHFLSSSRKSPEIWPADAVMPGLGIGRLAEVGSGDPIGVTWWPLHQLDPVAVGVMEP
jgi:hypothetical protein